MAVGLKRAVRVLGRDVKTRGKKIAKYMESLDSRSSSLDLLESTCSCYVVGIFLATCSQSRNVGDDS